MSTKQTLPKPTVTRDNLYYIILSRVQKKYPNYSQAQLYAVATALRRKSMAKYT